MKNWQDYLPKNTNVGVNHSTDGSKSSSMIESDINIPFVMKWDRENNELDMIAKTVKRKKNSNKRSKSRVENIPIQCCPNWTQY